MSHRMRGASLVDTPFNFARETLKHDKMVGVTQKALVRKSLEILAEMAKRPDNDNDNDTHMSNEGLALQARV